MAIIPDTTNAQPCCTAMKPHHYGDCPIAIERAERQREDALRLLRTVTGRADY